MGTPLRRAAHREVPQVTDPAVITERLEEIRNWIAEHLESQANWRRGKAEEYPDDENRNLVAAQGLEDAAAQSRELTDLRVFGTLAELIEGSGWPVETISFSNSLGDVTSQLGFWMRRPQPGLPEVIGVIERATADAIAEYWLEFADEPGFNQPPRDLVSLVEEITGERAFK